MAVRTPADTDTWWHLASGRVMLEESRILQTDLFSHTRYGSSWVNHSWLSQIILYWLFDHFSYAGLGLWMAAVVTLAFILVYLQMEGDVFTRAFITVIAAATSAVIWSARPQLFSFLFTAVVSYILYLFKRRSVFTLNVSRFTLHVSPLWLLPPLFVLWVNLHAGYALGFMVLVAFVAGEAFNHLLEAIGHTDDPVVGWRGIGLVVGTALLSAFLLVLNPNTTRMWTYYLETVRIDVLQDVIQEWQSPNFHPLHTQPFIWLLMATLATMGLSRRKVDGTDLALVTMFGYAALMAGRNFGPFALVTAPVLSRHTSAILKEADAIPRKPAPRRLRTSTGKAILNWSLLALIVALGTFKAYQPLQPEFNEKQRRESLPVEAAAWIERHQPEGRMFNHYNWGGYLIWRLWPDYRVFVDGRTDLYGNDFLRRYLDVQMGQPGFEETLANHQVSWVLTTPAAPLSMQLACQGGWEEVYRDDIAAIWVKENEITFQSFEQELQATVPGAPWGRKLFPR